MKSLKYLKVSSAAFVPFIYLLLLAGSSTAQTLPLSALENIQDSVRNSQLMGKDSTRSSYLIRPVSIPLFGKEIYKSRDGNISFSVLPLLLQQQLNTHHPYGSNDNSIIPAKGYQLMASAGIYFKAGPLRIQAYPEYGYAENREFKQPEMVGNDLYYAYPGLVYNRIDNPSRFGNSAYNKINWGQSSVRLNFDPLSIGLSNENIWWGPGRKNSLLMSNDAGGFKHFTLNTTRPVDIKIGKIEAQAILGKLEPSGVPIPENLPGSTSNSFKDKISTWRTIAAFTIAYQPKWVSGLSIGFDRSAVAYHNNTDSAMKLASFFARWLMPESNTEVYAQYGTNTHVKNLQGRILKSNAYLVGFNKLIPLSRSGEYIQAGIEFTQLEVPKNGSLSTKPSWYTDDFVRHGYTNRGQLLGAAVGPGGSMQSLDVNWIKGYKRIGIIVDRLVHNNDFFYDAAAPVSDLRRHWVDLALGSKFSWDFHRLILNTQLTYIKSFNYQWGFKYVDKIFYWDLPKQDKNNVQMKVGLMYNF